MASNRTRRLIAVGAFVAAAVAGPLYRREQLSTTAPQVTAAPGACLAWFGNKEDGKCLSYSNGQPVNVGTPRSSASSADPGSNWTGSHRHRCCRPDLNRAIG